MEMVEIGMDKRVKKAIVTGANGFVGGAVCRQLCECGVETIAVVRNLSSDLSRLDGLDIRVVQCELNDLSSLPENVDDRDIDAFFHFAWEGSSGEKRASSEVQINNIRQSIEALNVCKKLNCSRFLYAASIMEYEVLAAMKREIALGSSSVYSIAKLSSDYFLRTIADTLGVSYYSCIISNIYGPGEKNARLINSSLRKMLKGEHCSFSPGEQLYDFVYIEDAAKMFCKIAETGIGGKQYYIGNGEILPLKDYLLRMRNVVDPDIAIGLGELEFHGVSLDYSEIDIASVKNDTGFEHEVSFEEGIRRTLQAIKDEENV